MALKIPKEGDTLTVNCEIITIGGQITFEKGQKVIIRDIEVEKGHYSRICPDVWYDNRLLWVKLEGYHGLWQPDCFEELSEEV